MDIINKHFGLEKSKMEMNFLTVKEVAKQLRLHPETVRRFIREKKLRAYKIGKSNLLKPDDVKLFFASKCR